jgi:DNA-binding FrmR family transcriptional regulator
MSESRAVITRLRRIEGQIRGLARMVEQEKPCDQVLTQLMAARGALDQAGLKVIDHYIDSCLPDNAAPEEIRSARLRLQAVLQPLGGGPEPKEELEVTYRLRRIESHVSHLIEMIEQEKPCEQILAHLMAARGALDQAGLGVIASYMDHCLHDDATAEEIQQARHNVRRALELLLRMR